MIRFTKTTGTELLCLKNAKNKCLTQYKPDPIYNLNQCFIG